jgi:hypothetical protein
MVNIVSSAIGVGIAAKQPKGRTISDYPLPKRLASTSSIRQGLTECNGLPHSAQRSRWESCATFWKPGELPFSARLVAL